MNTKWTVRKELFFPAVVLACLAAGTWAGAQTKAMQPRLEVSQSQLLKVQQIAAQAAHLRQSQPSLSAPISQAAITSAFGATAQFNAQGEGASMHLQAVPGPAFLAGIEKLQREHKASVTGARLTVLGGAVTGSVDLAVAPSQ